MTTELFQFRSADTEQYIRALSPTLVKLGDKLVDQLAVLLDPWTECFAGAHQRHPFRLSTRS